jgi:hypothetical protein
MYFAMILQNNYRGAELGRKGAGGAEKDHNTALDHVQQRRGKKKGKGVVGPFRQVTLYTIGRILTKIIVTTHL